MKLLNSCAACGSEIEPTNAFVRQRVASSKGRIDISLVECGCGHVFTNPQPSSDELAPFYAENYHVFADETFDDAAIDCLIADRFNGERFNHLRVTPGGRYLDIGCGLGTSVAAMARLGMDARGVEPSPIAAKKATDAGRRSVFCGTLEEARFEDGLFDCISMFHVLEHVHDPSSLLAECRRVLAPGGELVVAVPNYDSIVRRIVGSTWGGLDLPRHLHQFRMSSLERVADRAGLKITGWETESQAVHVESALSRWLRKRMFLPARLTLASGITRPFARYLAALGNRSGRGEAIVARMCR